MDITASIGGNTHVFIDEEKRVVAGALRQLRDRYETKADDYRRGMVERARIAQYFDRRAADVDELLAYFE